VQQQQDVVADHVYRNGLLTVGLITFLFASNSPAVHAAFSQVSHPNAPLPVLLLNAAVSCTALASVTFLGPMLQTMVPAPSLLETSTSESSVSSSSTASITDTTTGVQQQQALESSSVSSVSVSSKNPFSTIMTDTLEHNLNIPIEWQGGMELGLWKFLGTTANLAGLSQTSADHGAFLIQLTTLIVPVAQGMAGVPITKRIWSAMALAMAGVFMFTQDNGGGGGSSVSSAGSMDSLDAVLQSTTSLSLQGDALCVVAAIFYATYDLRLFSWGKRIAPLALITNKVTTQACLSVGLLAAVTAYGSMHVAGEGSGSASGTNEMLESVLEFFAGASGRDLALVGAVTLWSGMIVNGIVPYLQVGGQQAVGPTKAQILYASQPLWAALMSLVFLGETVGNQGMVGGAAFMGAMMLAATAPEQTLKENE
jgi:drug/metabolite transporter (DMT)-like permease